MSTRPPEQRSLSEVHGTVRVPVTRSPWRKLLAFAGPAYLVSVGYMDPGNWATDIEGGSRFGYQLIWVLLMSNLMAQLLQHLCVRLGVVRGLDLAQANRYTYPPFINIPLYVLCEIAIAACDLAEVIGMAIGLQLLFDLPVLYGVLITALDTLIVLFLMQRGMRLIEAFILSLVAMIGVAFLVEMFIVEPQAGAVAAGFVPSVLSGKALYIAIGIIGATVMPHNLYLHSALVQTRNIGEGADNMRRAIRYNTIDTTIALNIAFLVNAAILILAAAAFHMNSMREVADIKDAHHLLSGLFGGLAPALFAIALIASGQSSTITGTLAGQIVMEGYLNLRLRPWLRRLITRLIAIIPALACIIWIGEDSLGELLVLSQVVLSLQLGFAVIPLIHFTSDRRHMKEFAVRGWKLWAAWASALIIVGLNAKLVIEKLGEWITNMGSGAIWIQVLVVPLVVVFGLLLLYITFSPFLGRALRSPRTVPHGNAAAIEAPAGRAHQRICVTVDFSAMDKHTIQTALEQGGPLTEYVLIHVVESAGARYHGEQTLDHESQSDAANMQVYVDRLRDLGYTAEYRIGYGGSVRAIAQCVNESRADLLVMGAHGHRGWKDILFGATVDAVRHRVKVPVLIVK